MNQKDKIAIELMSEMAVLEESLSDEYLKEHRRWLVNKVKELCEAWLREHEKE